MALIAIVVVASVSALVFVLPMVQPEDSKTLSYFKAKIYYTDGTSTEYLPVTTPELTIIDSNINKQVSRIQIELYVRPVFTGDVTSWSASTEFSADVREATTQRVVTNLGGAQSMEKNGGSIVSNTAFVVTSSSISSSDFESLYDKWDNGKTYYYVFKLEKPLTMTLTFEDGSTATKTATTRDLFWAFRYEHTNAFTSLSVSWGINPT